MDIFVRSAKITSKDNIKINKIEDNEDRKKYLDISIEELTEMCEKYKKQLVNLKN